MVLLIIPHHVYAMAEFDPSEKVFSVSFIFQNNTLRYFNNDAPYSVESSILYPLDTPVPQGPQSYKIETLDARGRSVSSILFNPATKLKDSSGRMDVNLPYDSRVQKILVYRPNGEIFGDIDSAFTTLCIEDGRCDLTQGETTLTCPADCKTGLGQIAPTPTRTPVQIQPSFAPGKTPIAGSQGGAQTAESNNFGFIAGLIAIIVAISGLAVFAYWVIKKRNSSSP